MEEKKVSDRKPMILVFAGPNGSGKSTIKGYFQIVGEYTNADDLVTVAGIDNYKAAIEVDARRYRAIDERRDFTFETVLSSEYKMNLLKEAHEKGYFIKCIFVLTTNPQINIARVKTRALSGGHSVPDDKIVSRYKKSLSNIPRLLELCDIMHVYDNSADDKVERIIRKHKNEFAIFPNNIWSEDRIVKLINGNLY